MAMRLCMQSMAVLLVVLFTCDMQAQVRLKRQVVSSFGGSASPNASYYTSFTAGQPTILGTLFNENYIRQGFEQPKENDNCGLLNNFVVEQRTSSCGSFYSFEFTGVVPDGVEFKWDFGGHAVPPMSDEMNPMDVVYELDSALTLIRLTLTTEDGCTNTSAQFINVLSGGFSSRVVAEDVECSDELYSLSVEPIEGTAPYQIEWSDGGTELSRELSEGTYDYTLTDAGDCTAQGTVDLQGLRTVLQLDGTPDAASCDLSSLGSIDLSVIGGVPPYTFNWSNGTVTEDALDLLPGVYSVEVTDSRNCKVSAEFVVGTDCLDEDNVPNIITPNGDADNDVWVIPGIENFPNNQLEIYNRWGSPVIDFAPYMNNWAGTNKDGSELPMGAYYYVLQLNDGNGTKYSGSLTILR